jgi:hypothetical protein
VCLEVAGRLNIQECRLARCFALFDMPKNHCMMRNDCQHGWSSELVQGRGSGASNWPNQGSGDGGKFLRWNLGQLFQLLNTGLVILTTNPTTSQKAILGQNYVRPSAVSRNCVSNNIGRRLCCEKALQSVVMMVQRLTAGQKS